MKPTDTDAGNVPSLKREGEARRVSYWDTGVGEMLAAEFGASEAARLGDRWIGVFPPPYKAAVAPNIACLDIAALDRLSQSGDQRLVTLKHEPGPDGTFTRIALFSRNQKAELSRIVKILEDLGLHVIEERAAHISSHEEFWLQDFGVLGPDGLPLDLQACGERVAACVDAVLSGHAESDGLHELIVTTELGHEQIGFLRAFRSYRARIGSRYTDRFQNEAIVTHPKITADQLRLFELRFDAQVPRDEAAEQALHAQILRELDDVPSLDHDRILRNQLALIDATVRTNAYFEHRPALALKIRAGDVPATVQPAPLWEIYVYAAHLEGVHLRGGTIARGGLRWSDREDFRTEVYGLMRAQMVKNAVIVPTGAKGGFRLRRPPSDPAELREAVHHAYVDFVGALLDVTDNRAGGGVVHPRDVRVLDGDDPYLVVAADKGTATFSDTANEIADRRGFWLGDAFASGGSHGYDHKALGITARGAWESVKRHFRERGVHPERDPVTVVGIGDMSGDVFGNGLLRSRTLRLVAAYDHRHIFLDPDPGDAEAAWTERARLFALPRSSWADYDAGLLSPGGGVFPRTLKSIPLSAQVRTRLGVEDKEFAPADLIRAILRADVDLLWNGGIGTVVKASSETDLDAQDRSSDALRVDANELRCTVVGEGGNLGFTHPARIEFAQLGGAINADFIDNSAGVDCSDHEVNWKILLGEAQDRGELGETERDQLLADATGDVTEHVLRHSYNQALILAQEDRRSHLRIDAYEELMSSLEQRDMLRRRDHDLPSSEELTERRAAGRGMARPELAVLLSLAKSTAADELLDSAYVDDPDLLADLREYFPASFQERFGELIWEHPLRRELIATQAANAVVDAMGPTFIFRRAAEFGARVSEVVRSTRIAIEVCDAEALWDQVDAQAVTDPALLWELIGVVDDAVRQVSRWYLSGHVDAPIIATALEHGTAARALERSAQPSPEQLADAQRWRDGGVDEALVQRLIDAQVLPFAPHLAGVATQTGTTIEQLVAAVAELRDALPIDALQRMVAALPSTTRVARWANQALRDDLLTGVAKLAGQVASSSVADPHMATQLVLDSRPAAIRRLASLVREGQLAPHMAVAGTTLAVRQLRELSNGR